MASRATPPASFLASAQPSARARPRQRPRFAHIPSARTASPSPSSSAAQAARSDESLTATLKSLAFPDGPKSPAGAGPGTSTANSTANAAANTAAGGDVRLPAHPAAGASWNARRLQSPAPADASCTGRPASPTREEYLKETPGRRQSKPINIEPPKNRPAPVYTPLSARGDLPGGYFPNHETLSRQYRTHPFFNKPESSPSSPIMSNASSTLSSPSGNAPHPMQAITSPSSSDAASPEALAIPMGKYHPSNYKPLSPGVPTSLSPIPAPLSPAQLEIPSPGQSNKRPAYERRSTDVKRKLQQYQRDMVAQARLASMPTSQPQPESAKPSSPKLQPQPLSSPGPITPLELEESSGYLVAGMREADRERQREAVGKMIDQERGMKGTGNGSASPVLSI